MATEKELNIILRARDEASKVLKDVKNGADQWGKALTAAGVAGAGAFAAATKVAADFEQGLSNVKAVSGATTTEMAKLHDLALQLGKDTSFSASEAVAGMEELIKGGLTPAQVQAGALKGALDLAAAGEIDLASAAEIAATALNTFKLKGEDMAHVADLLAGAANASATDVGELKMAIAQSGLVAAQVGVSLDDLTTTLGVFANNGLKGSDAGTSLKTMLMRLVPTTKEATNLMRDLGMITADGKNQFYDAAGNLKSMSEVAGLLATSTKDLTNEEKQFFLGQIFGQDAIRAVNALLSAGTEGFDDMATAIGKVSAADVAAEKLNNLKGGLEQLKGSVETIAIVVGERFLPYIRQATTWLTNLANRFLELSPGVQDMIIKAALLATGFALIAGPILLFIGQLGAIGGALGALAGPVGLVIAGLGLLYLAFVNNWGGIRDLTIQAGTEMVEWFKANWPMIRDTVVAVFQEARAVLEPILAALLQIIVATFQAVWPVIKAAMAIAKQVFDATWPVMLEIVRWFVDSILPWVVETFQKISDWIGEIMPYVQTIIETVLNVMMAVWKFAFEFLWPIVKAVFELVKSVIGTALDLVMGVIKTVLQLITGDWSGAWETIKQTAAAVWAGIGDIVRTALLVLWTFINQLLGGWPQKIFDILVAVWAFMQTVWAKVKEITITAITELATWINDSLGGWPKRIYDALLGIWQTFTDIWQGVKDQSIKFLADVWKAIWAQLTGWTQKARDWAKGFVDTIKNALSWGKSEMADAAADVAQGVADNLELNSPAREGPMSNLDQWWKPLIDTLLGDHLKGTGQPAANFAADTMAGLALSGSPATNSGGARGPVIVQNYIQSQPTWDMEDVRKHVEQATMDALARMGLA